MTMGRGIGTPDTLPGDRSGPGSRQGNEPASMPPDAQGAVRRAFATVPGAGRRGGVATASQSPGRPQHAKVRPLDHLTYDERTAAAWLEKGGIWPDAIRRGVGPLPDSSRYQIWLHDNARPRA